MSRSYKKTPIVKDNKGGRKAAKKEANRKVRQSKDVPNGKQYRKFYNPWDIYDYVMYCDSYKEMSSYRKDEEKAKKLWYKYYYRK